MPKLNNFYAGMSAEQARAVDHSFKVGRMVQEAHEQSEARLGRKPANLFESLHALGYNLPRAKKFFTEMGSSVDGVPPRKEQLDMHLQAFMRFRAAQPTRKETPRQKEQRLEYVRGGKLHTGVRVSRR